MVTAPGTEQRAIRERQAVLAFEDLAANISECAPGATPDECWRIALLLIDQTASRVRLGEYVVLSRAHFSKLVQVAVNPANDPEPGGEPRVWTLWSQPLDISDTAVRERFGEVAAWWVNTKTPHGWELATTGHSRWPDPTEEDAAVSILYQSPRSPDISYRVDPAVIWDIGGSQVTVYHHGTPDGPATDAECSCRATGLCRHILAILARTKLHGEAASTPETAPDGEE
jgi:hypothetical protein